MSCPICQKEHAFTLSQAIARMAAMPKRLERLISRSTPQRVGARPAPNKWSAKEVVSHLADGELVYGMRYRKILAEPGSALVAFDQDAWAQGLNYRGLPVKHPLASFSALRAAHIALFKSLPQSAWGKSGRHPEYGELTLRHLVVHLSDHDDNHLAQVERLCPPTNPKPPKKAPGKR